MMIFPERPDVPLEQHARGQLSLRFEDIAQDGRIKLAAIPFALDVCWRSLLQGNAVGALERQGVLALLSRLVIEGGGGPLAVGPALEANTCFQLAHTTDDQGRCTRVLLNLHAELHGVQGRTYGEPQPGDGARIRIGRVFAEHVFTRPFAEPNDRRVVALEGVAGIDTIPGPSSPWRIPARVSDPPDGAKRLDNELRPAGTIVFGLAHTDSNQHVNSLVYPQVFEQLALARFRELGRPATLLATDVEVAYRKPCFAGDAMQVTIQAFEHNQQLGAVGSFVPMAGDDRRPHCYVRMRFG